ncbi:MAG TPA: sulfatase-like hydrolase/transferase [Anaerolineales bacterium]|nr:sulfatase-like hydrolase/transferase [Anaerolineales bacterium]
MKILFLFLDGVGLGANDPNINPFARAELPNLNSLLQGQALLSETAPFDGKRASLLALDACLGVEGLPQSATGQATLLTGINVPAMLGYHYGPKPNILIAQILKNGNLFSKLRNEGKHAALINAYPPGYFSTIESGRRIYSAIPLAVTSAGLKLKTTDDLLKQHAIAADFTALGWREHLGLTDTPTLTPSQAGTQLASLSRKYDFMLFEYWLSDLVGHRQDLESACSLLEVFDQVLGSLVNSWQDEEGLIIITSDHGNLEDLSTRRHTSNPVPALLIGSKTVRRSIQSRLKSLTDIAPTIMQLLLK